MEEDPKDVEDITPGDVQSSASEPNRSPPAMTGGTDCNGQWNPKCENAEPFCYMERDQEQLKTFDDGTRSKTDPFPTFRCACSETLPIIGQLPSMEVKILAQLGYVMYVRTVHCSMQLISDLQGQFFGYCLQAKHLTDSIAIIFEEQIMMYDLLDIFRYVCCCVPYSELKKNKTGSKAGQSRDYRCPDVGNGFLDRDSYPFLELNDMRSPFRPMLPSWKGRFKAGNKRVAAGQGKKKGKGGKGKNQGTVGSIYAPGNAPTGPAMIPGPQPLQPGMNGPGIMPPGQPMMMPTPVTSMMPQFIPVICAPPQVDPGSAQSQFPGLSAATSPSAPTKQQTFGAKEKKGANVVTGVQQGVVRPQPYGFYSYAAGADAEAQEGQKPTVDRQTFEVSAFREIVSFHRDLDFYFKIQE
ncbi:unnamed protein product [Cyprideis torosa]|uniref:Uncharacterized protein n=1 Tax=Cyprideis torosa TaxID=163714 RepID=A0A7R8W1E8_9CRUS|nr:unnamed protein product [Cyprideis torosa]CAG0880839.1 unnamed protein product [Cyprideis torosa]